MKEKEIKNQISRFSEIEPEKRFTEESRFELLSIIDNSNNKVFNPKENKAFIGFIREFIIEKPAQLASAITMATIIFVVTYYAVTQISPLFLPGLNKDKIVAEAEMINQKINIEVNKLEHFSSIAKESNEILNEVSKSSFNYLNESIIKGEAIQVDDINGENKDTNEEINSILNEMSK